MSKLVVFGDSFVNNEHQFLPEESKLNYDSYDNNWINQLANKLSLTEINYGLEGSSIEYSLSKFYDHIRQNDNSNDICIFALTSPDRQYWGDQYNDVMFTDFDHDSNDEIEDNVLHWLIDNEQVSKMEGRWINTICMLHNFSHLFKKLIIVNCFSTYEIIDDLYQYVRSDGAQLVNGSLREHISKDEYKSEESGIDPRPNHMSDENHKILSDEFYKAIVDDFKLDLTTIQFVRDIY